MIEPQGGGWDVDPSILMALGRRKTEGCRGGFGWGW